MPPSGDDKLTREQLDTLMRAIYSSEGESDQDVSGAERVRCYFFRTFARSQMILYFPHSETYNEYVAGGLDEEQLGLAGGLVFE